MPEFDLADAPREFVHEKCATITRMPEEMVVGYLANPHRYNDWAFCSKCDGFVPHRECHWKDSNEKLDAYFKRLKAARPAPPASGVLAYLAAIVLTIAGAGIGYYIDGNRGLLIGFLGGLGLGLLLVIARLIGLR